MLPIHSSTLREPVNVLAPTIFNRLSPFLLEVHMIYEFKEFEDYLYSDDFLYDLFETGYINPYELLQHIHQADKVHDAMEVVQSFLQQLEEIEVFK